MRHPLMITTPRKMRRRKVLLKRVEQLTKVRRIRKEMHRNQKKGVGR
jgi:hypothetical protein